MRTLVVSDLHLGTRLRRDVLRTPIALDALLAAIDDADRLVLLGDTVELAEGRTSRALEAAEPVLRAIGARLGAGREAILVPGNHDRPLIRPWLRGREALLTVDECIPQAATAVLARVTNWLAPARVEVRYPGVWLADRVWATHGHYLDRHLLPESAFGIARGLLGRLPRDGATPMDYERAGGPSLTRLETGVARWLPRSLAALVEDGAEFLRAATMPGFERRVLSQRFAPLTSKLLGFQMRRASIPAMARVVHRLRVDADWVIFGHVHRRGPLAGERVDRWAGPDGTPQILNTGSWVYEPLLVHRAAAPHPYWPGGAVILQDGRLPQTIGLLDDLPGRALR